jgi:hypothetical protein
MRFQVCGLVVVLGLASVPGSLGACTGAETEPSAHGSTGVGASGTGAGGNGAAGSGAGGRASGGGGAAGEGGSGAGGMGGASGGAGGTGGRGGGLNATCTDVSADYGDCTSLLGYGFTGQDCVQLAGCSCDPNCADIHPDLAGCLAGCGGTCDHAAFLGFAGAMSGWGVGDYCDDVSVCADADLVTQLQGFFPGLVCDPAGSSPCGAAEQRCYLYFSGSITRAQYAKLCSMTLVEGVAALYCALYL